MRLLVESDCKPVGGIIGAGFDELRWPLPVRPGDDITAEAEILSVRDDKPICTLRTTITNND